MARLSFASVWMPLLAQIGSAQWTAVQEAELFASDRAPVDGFGRSVALGGDTAIIGAPRADSGSAVLDSVRGLAFDSATGRMFETEELDPRLFEVDPVTGEGTVLTNSLPGNGGLAFDPWKQLVYSTTLFPGDPDSRLHSYDPATGIIASVGLGKIASYQIEGLAIPFGQSFLYGADTSGDRLVSIRRSNAVGTTIGPFGVSGVRALAFDQATGRLYGSTTDLDLLLEIDPTTGVATAIGPLGFDDVQGLSFDSASGTLYGTDSDTDQLLTIDVRTGAGTAVVSLTAPVVEAGAAYFVTRSAGAWAEQDRLQAGTPIRRSLFGWSVALDGDTLVVGAPGPDYVSGASGFGAGTVHVFQRLGNTWTERGVLAASDGSGRNRFGSHLALEGDTLLVGADFDGHAGPESGAVYVFEREAGDWTETQKLTAGGAAAFDRFGAVALSGNTLLAGAPGRANRGVAFVFDYDGTSWIQSARLAKTETPIRSNFGASVALDGHRALVGDPAFRPSLSSSNVGRAFLFERERTAWSPGTMLMKGDTPIASSYFGNCVVLRGDQALIGQPIKKGHAFLFTPQGTAWGNAIKVQAPVGGGLTGFGSSIAVDGDTVIVGAPHDLAAVDLDAGSAFVFRLTPPPPANYCTAGTSANGCIATLSAAGTPSATASSGFTVTASGVEGHRPGLFIYGRGLRKTTTWGSSSFQCIGSPFLRGGAMVPVGTLGSCDGSFSLDLNARWCVTGLQPIDGLREGAVMQVQLWYRDSFNTSSVGSSLSDAIEFWVGP